MWVKRVYNSWPVHVDQSVTRAPVCWLEGAAVAGRRELSCESVKKTPTTGAAKGI